MYNKPKRGPVYINLDEESAGSVEVLTNRVHKMQKVQVHKMQAAGSTASIVPKHGILDIRSEWEMRNGSQAAQNTG